MLFSFVLLSPNLNDVSKNILFEFINQMNLISGFFKKLSEMIFKVQFIQRKYKLLKKSLANRANFIRSQLLFKKQAYLSKELKLYGGKKYQNLATQVKLLSNEKKDFVTQVLINLAKYDFRVQFMKWFLKNKDLDDDKIQSVK